LQGSWHVRMSVPDSVLLRCGHRHHAFRA
jgi:hypothetical protein